ncbi:hypothetical protein Patl1_03188 [Pistacia atlantica]|uniref:Uncharacterized protein n=1 Tax=Pistacia atlantica TaxID=434234 RepID=A0ACC1CCG0_9ROSI|nr:hypothetical protein Patl1_03188 [Pistacia atlantica]
MLQFDDMNFNNVKTNFLRLYNIIEFDGLVSPLNLLTCKLK